MIYREFDKLKFKRTYIGGSKQEELKRFKKVQGTKEDNSECNWIEYRKMLKQYLDDKLNIILSWKYLSGILRISFIVPALLFSIINIGIGIFVLLVAVIFHILFWHFKCLEQKKLSEYNFSLNIINQQTGLNLNKN